MSLSFHSIRDNGNFLFTSGRPGTYYYWRAELSPREAWNLWQDAQACQQGSWGFPLHLTSPEFERVTAFDPARPDESRAERVQTLFKEVAKLDWASQAKRNDQAVYCGDQNELGKNFLLQNKSCFGQTITIPTPELEKAWDAYRARSVIAQPVL